MRFFIVAHTETILKQISDLLCRPQVKLQEFLPTGLTFPDLISSGQIKATFTTSTKLSETAKRFADALGVKVIEEEPLKKHPPIKCIIANDGGEKIRTRVT